jgi:hypothetical protein
MDMQQLINQYAIEIIIALVIPLLLFVSRRVAMIYHDLVFSKKYAGYIGTYYIYAFSTTGEDRIVCNKITISFRLGKLRISGDEEVFRYAGDISVNEKNIYFHLYGLEHSEEQLYVFVNPIHRNIRKLWGIQGCISVIDEPVARICLLSQDPLADTVVRQEIAQMTSKQYGHMLKILRDSRVYRDNLVDGQCGRSIVTMVVPGNSKAGHSMVGNGNKDAN